MKLDKRILIGILIIGIVAICVGVTGIGSHEAKPSNLPQIEEPDTPRYTEEAVIGIATNYVESQGKVAMQRYTNGAPLEARYQGNGLWEAYIPTKGIGGHTITVYVDERTGAVH